MGAGHVGNDTKLAIFRGYLMRTFSCLIKISSHRKSSKESLSLVSRHRDFNVCVSCIMCLCCDCAAPLLNSQPRQDNTRK